VTLEYKGYRIETHRNFRAASIHPPYGGLPLARMASASGEDRETALLEDARAIIDDDIVDRGEATSA
jgi:hypothetical protein